MKHSLAVLCLCTLLALASLHPLWGALDSAVPGDVGDPLLNAYLLAWDTRALVTDPVHLFDAGIFYPLRNTLAYSENLLGSALFALPVAALGGEPLLVYNFVILSGYVLSGYGMYLLVLGMTRDRWAGIVAGIAFAFAPYRLASLAHVQLVTVQWLPFALVALAGVLEGRRGSLLLFGVFAWLQAAATLHGALFLLVVVLVALVLNLASLRQALSRTLAGGVLLLALALLPLALPYAVALPALQDARPPAAASGFLAQPADWLAAWGYNWMYGDATSILRRRGGFTEEHLLFMGLVIPVLAVCGLWFGRASRWTAVFAVLLALGVLLASWDGPLQALPLLSVMRVPARWATVAVFALAALAGLGAAGLLWHAQRRAARVLVGALLCLLVLTDGVSMPVPVARAGNLSAQNGVYHYLAREGAPGALIELPLYVAPDAEYPEGKRMLAGTLHWRPLVNGYSGITPPRQSALATQLRGFPDEASLAALRALGAQGVRYLIVHAGEAGIPRREWVQGGRVRAQASGVLRYVQAFDDNDLFEIAP